jgi:hypothetical protein
MAQLPRRAFLARRVGLSSVERVYRTRDAIEVDELEGYDVTRRRVLFDEVLLVTHHQEVGWPFVVGMLIVITLMGFVSLVTAAADPRTGLGLALFAVLPFVVLLVLRLALRVDVVTVHSRRTRARIPFWFQKDRAREVFRLITRLAQEHQDRLAQAQQTGRPPAPEPPLPPVGPASGPAVS